MKLTENQINKIKEYARFDYPNETCGIINSEGKVIRLKNIAEDTETHFILPHNTFISHDVVGVFHSHCNKADDMTEQDMQSQIATSVPWILCACFPDTITEPFSWGDDYTPPLIGREFRHGASGSDDKGDCYALIKDWYFLEKGVKLPVYPRSNFWWDNGKDLYSDFFGSAGFEEVDVKGIPQIGDVALMKIRSKVENHAAVFVEDQFFLHHLYNRLSRREPAARWNRMISRWVRYVKKD